MKGLRLLRGSLLLASLAIAAVPIPAAAVDLVADVVLYETSETITPPTRTAPLLGSARIGSPLCAAVVALGIGGSTCTVTGAGTVNFLTSEVGGALAVVVEGADVAFLGAPDTNTSDVAEFVVMTATFTAVGITPLPLPAGTPPALAQKLLEKFAETGFWSLLQIQGTVTIGSSTLNFTGTFRLPFALSRDGAGGDEDVQKPRRNRPAFYLSASGRLLRVRNDELAVGYPTPRLEVTFTP